MYSPSLPGGRNFGTRSTFADLGATLAEVFRVPPMPVGQSLLR